MFAEDLAMLFEDFGVAAVFGARTATVILDMPQEEIFDGMQQSTEYAITYKTGDLPGLKANDSGTVNGVTYRVRQVTTLDDGQIIKATLQR